MLFDNQCRAWSIINSTPLSLNALGIWWLSLLVHIQCSSTSMCCVDSSILISWYIFPSFCHISKNYQKTTLEQVEKNNQSSKRELKGCRKLRNVMIIFVSAVTLISVDASGLGCVSCLGVEDMGMGFWKEPPSGVLGAPWLSQDPRSPSIWTMHSVRVMFHLSLA